jgi:hypothetical protein
MSRSAHSRYWLAGQEEGDLQILIGVLLCLAGSSKPSDEDVRDVKDAVANAAWTLDMEVWGSVEAMRR